MKIVVKYFVNGLLFLVPVLVTVYVVYWVFSTIDHAVGSLIVAGLDETEPSWWVSGLGVVISLVFITLVGLLTRLFITRPITQLVERLFGKLPLIKLLYGSIKDLVGAFVGEKKRFDKPVLVELVPGSSAKAMGFVTRESMEFMGLADELAVYFPQSYNFAGSVLIVPKSQITPLDVDSSDVMAFIVSGGVSGKAETVT